MENRSFISSLIWFVIIWIMAAFLFGLIRVWGVETLPSFERVIPFDPLLFSIDMLILGTAVGIPFGILDYLMKKTNMHRMAYWKIITIKTTVQIVLAFFSLGMLLVIDTKIENVDITLINFVFSKTSLLWIIYTGIVSLFIYVMQVVKTKIGGRVLINLLLGKYHNPRVENRIFMFIDMKDSTTWAEKLGHIRFSSLIQDSLNDLTPAIVKHKVEVYQYVGDEAVLTWQLDEGFENDNCLEAYYTFMQTLHEKKAYYNQKYGFMPFFKAGVHLGEVTVSEVGIIKKEIAYHSDVLNTAARIQGKCNEFDAELLISEDLKEKLKSTKDFQFERIGGVVLKGKQKPVNIYKVHLTRIIHV